MKTIYLAGGCFWGTERVFKSLRGVAETTVGYANGHTANPTYKEVCTDTTGHRETVKVEYDPEAIALSTILKAYFLVIDPEVKDQQGHDIGTQYQTGIYYADDADLPAKGRDRVVGHIPELAPLDVFYSAEEYHQDYLEKNPSGYCHITPVQMDEVKKLQE